MNWLQKPIRLKPYARGCHLVTNSILSELDELRNMRVGMLNLFLQHTSAALSVNENADPDVRVDMETMLNSIVPEGQKILHTIEGPDDMPAHVKSSLFGCSLSIPISNGRLALGTWQGIYLCEFRNRGGARSIVATAFGESS